MNKLPSPQETEWPEGAIFTVGHSTLPIERFIAFLHIYGIKCLRPSSEDVDWLRRTLDRESAPFGTRVELAPGGRLAVS